MSSRAQPSSAPAGPCPCGDAAQGADRFGPASAAKPGVGLQGVVEHPHRGALAVRLTHREVRGQRHHAVRLDEVLVQPDAVQPMDEAVVSQDREGHRVSADASTARLDRHTGHLPSVGRNCQRGLEPA